MHSCECKMQVPVDYDLATTAIEASRAVDCSANALWPDHHQSNSLPSRKSACVIDPPYVK